MDDPRVPAGAPISRREQIIAVAAELFSERGFHGVSIYDIGAAMGTSGPALYKHFASKDALLGEMLVGISERLLSEAQRRADVADGEGADAVLEALVGWHVEFALAHPALITVQFRDLANATDDDQRIVRRLQRSYVERWADAIRAVVGGDDANARAAAHAVFGLINSTPHSALLDRDEMTQLLRRMALAAVHASPS
jgi:AcrR family transcriptional regulator